jgi:hypothetical protein
LGADQNNQAVELVGDPDLFDIEREHSVASIIAQALDLYQYYPLLFLTLALAVVGPYELAVLAITGSGSLGRAHGGAALLLTLLDYVLVAPLISALHIHAVALISDGKKPHLGEVAVSGLRVLPVVAAAVIAAAFGIALGYLALIVPGILLSLRWSVVAQVAAMDGEGWMPALDGSRQLTRGHYLHILGLVLIGGILTGGVTIAARAIPAGSSAGVASVILGIATHTVTASFSALLFAILYFDLRARRAGPSEGSPASHA